MMKSLKPGYVLASSSRGTEWLAQRARRGDKALSDGVSITTHDRLVEVAFPWRNPLLP
jgi:hypothetical protein